MYATPTTIQPPHPNVDLLRQTLALIEAHPETWYQADYRCRSGMCFAGQATELAGGRWIYSAPDVAYSSYLIAEPGDDPGAVVACLDEPAVSARYRAQRVLGLTRDQAYELFHPSNTLDDLRRVVAELCGEAS